MVVLNAWSRWQVMVVGVLLFLGEVCKSLVDPVKDEGREGRGSRSKPSTTIITTIITTITTSTTTNLGQIFRSTVIQLAFGPCG